MARVVTTSELPATPDRVWERLQRVDTLVRVAAPLNAMSVPADTPATWELERPVPLTSKLYGIVPLGVQTVTFVEIDHDDRRARTTESGGSVRRWEHVMTVTGPDDGPATLTDEVDIDAGPMTAVVAAFARRLYAHRHRRWTELLADGTF